MIKTFYQEDIINRLAAIITYGINEGYSYKSIEEHITSSSFVNDLENNKYNIESRIEGVVESTFGISLEKNQADISFKGLFIAESYFKLFLYFHKSFEYIFLYWPLSYFLEKYVIYHEMDFSNLRKDFELRTKEDTLLKKLARDKNIKITDISKLTGINKNTINKYSKDDKYLYAASHENIYKLSILFDTKENIFVSNLSIFLDQSIYLFDKSRQNYRNYLGLYYANYYDSRINETDYVYDKKNNCFISNEGIRIVVVADVLDNLSINALSNIVDSKTYLVIIPSGFLGDDKKLNYLISIDAYEIFVLTQEYAYILKKNCKIEITDTVNRSLIIRAAETSSKNNS